MPETTDVNKISRPNRYYIIWTVMFGVTLALGGSLLEPIPIPILGSISFASIFVAFMITLNKLVVRRPLSVTFMYCVVSVLAIFTGYLGPPSPLKPLFILAGLSFDAATLFRTKNIKLWNILVGHAVVTITGFLAFWIIYSIHLPEAALTFRYLLVRLAPAHFIVSAIIATLVWYALRPWAPQPYLRRIWDQLNEDENV